MVIEEGIRVRWGLREFGGVGVLGGVGWLDGGVKVRDGRWDEVGSRWG